MKNRIFTLAGLAAFALGVGMTFTVSAASCITCHNNCDARFEACLAAGTSYTTCSSRATLCHRSCGCPIP